MKYMVLLLALLSGAAFADSPGVSELCDELQQSKFNGSEARRYHEHVSFRMFNRDFAIPVGFKIVDFNFGGVAFVRHIDGLPMGAIQLGKFVEGEDINTFVSENRDRICNVAGTGVYVMIEKDYIGSEREEFLNIQVFDDEKFISINSDSMALWSEFLDLQQAKR